MGYHMYMGTRDTAAPETKIMLTANETQMLQAILDSDYQDGNEGAECVGEAVWSWSANPFESKRTASGVASSLGKKGFAKSYDDGDENVIYITQAGYDALVEKRAGAE